MRVTLNCHRPGSAPGDIVELDEAEAAPLLAFGAAHLVEDEPAPETAQGAIVPITAASATAAPTGKPGPAQPAQAAQGGAQQPGGPGA